MTGWEVQEMWEADTNAEWERLNEPDPFEKQMETAAKSIRSATECLDKATSLLLDAVSDLYETPMEDRIASFYDQLRELRMDLNRIAERYERGERE